MKYSLNENDIKTMVIKSVKKVLNEMYDFGTTEPQYDVNSKEWQDKYDEMNRDLNGKNRSDNEKMMNIQIAHHLGKKGNAGFNEMPFEKGDYKNGKPRMPKKEKAYSEKTLKWKVKEKLEKGVPYNDIPNFEPFTPEQAEWLKDEYYVFKDYIEPIGTCLRGSYLVMHNTKTDKYIIDDEPLEFGIIGQRNDEHDF